jgi:adenosylcobinamide-GDP ribazoletransferase
VLGALSFLTVLGRARRPDAGAVVWFGPVGVLLGALLGALWWSGVAVWPPAVAAALVVAADAGLTGLLHLDGLADSADGLLPHLERDRRLAVMSTPDVGAFGIATVTVVLLLRFAALASSEPEGWRAVTFLAGVWCAARALMAFTIVVVPYARADGLAGAFRSMDDGTSRVPLVLTFVAAFGLAATRGVDGAVAVVAGVLTGGAVIAFARRRLGGFTGDILGAAGVMTETVSLVVASARWG